MKRIETDSHALILGSQSPRRQEILQRAGYRFSVRTSSAEEQVDPGMDVQAVPEALAVQKADHIYPLIEDRNAVLLTCDTVVILDDRILGKPADLTEARRFLRWLSGCSHEVVSGVCIRTASGYETFSDRTTVRFAKLEDDAIDAYVRHYEVLDKAGAYAIQEGIGLTGIESIQGSYYNVMGLPVHKVYSRLRSLGIRPKHA